MKCSNCGMKAVGAFGSNPLYPETYYCSTRCKETLIANKAPVADVLCNVGLSGSIPLLRGKPEIINDMKAVCCGEFHFEIEQTCSACYFHGVDEDCEICGGNIVYPRTVTVPWDLVKDIYKSMAGVALRAT